MGGVFAKHKSATGSSSQKQTVVPLGDEQKKKIQESFDFIKNYVPEKKVSLLKTCLDQETFEKVKDLTTSHGATLQDVINSGIENPECHVGVYAPDQEAYHVFSPLLDKIIEKYHNFSPSAQQPALEFGKPEDFPEIDPEGQYVISTRIRCARNLDGYGMHPIIHEKDYIELEGKMSKALKTMSGDLNGTYYPLVGMDKATQDRLIEDHFLFQEGDKYLASAGACEAWPKGRGIFHNADKTFLVWVNEEDHLRVISMEKGCNVQRIYKRWIDGLNHLEKVSGGFARDKRLGYVSFCPTNLGTGIRASVMIKLPNLAKNKAALDATAEQLGLQVRGQHGENSDAEGGEPIFDISNKRRLGLTEYECVKTMYDGCLKLIELEKAAGASSA